MGKIADRVKETTTTTGTGPVSLGGAVQGFQAFSAAFASGDLVYYCIEDGTNWEVGEGTLTSGTPWTLSRTTILASSNAGAAVNWGAGTKNVFCTAPAGAPGLLGREVLAANRTYYVATTGSDSNNGLSAGTPFLTIQKAINVVCSLDMSIYQVTIQVTNGTYTAGNNLNAYVGALPPIIKGDETTPANVIVSVTSQNCFVNESGCVWNVRGFTLTTATSGNCFNCTNGTIKFQNVDFGACAVYHIQAVYAGVVIAGNYTISGGAAFHSAAYDGGRFFCRYATVTLTGTPAFTTYAYCRAGFISAQGATYSGGATGIRYDVSMNGVVYVGGAGTSYLPGSTAGTTATGGQYA